MNDRLFELIRQEQVIVFAGAGTSLYAGYPSGNQLKEIIYNSLNNFEKVGIDKNLPLPNFTELFCRIKNDNRVSLNRILINEFVHKKPKSITWHKKLSKISHFKTIITTNYDTLFERGYGDKGHLIFKSSHLTKSSKKQTEIFKIHGDITEVNNIIITNNDYNGFFKDNSEQSVFWSTIKSRMAMNSILFLGYSLEDPNIKIIFDKICAELGENRKEVFFISPSLQTYNVEYLKGMGIHYIKMNSKAFLNQLIKSIETNVVSDYNNKKISNDTFFDYTKNYGLFPNLELHNGHSIVSSFKIIDKNIKPIIDLDFEDGWNLQNEISNHYKQKNFDNLVVPKDKIKKLVMRYGKIEMPRKDFLQLEFSPQPTVVTKIDIKFENGFEYDDIGIKVYKKNNFAQIIAQLKNSKCIIQHDLEDINNLQFTMTHDHNEFCGKLKQEIDEMKLLINFGEGIGYNIFESGKLILKPEPIKNEEFLHFTKTYLKYFEDLKIIENYYGIIFKDFRYEEISDKTEEHVFYIISVINNECISSNWNGSYNIELLNENKELILGESKMNPIFPHSNPEIIKLHGHEINIGYRITQLANMYISNYDDLIEGNTNIAVLKSKNNKLLIRYTKEKLNVLN